MNLSSKPGLYVHIPFCQSKCGYCDFYSVSGTALVSPFIKALKTEIAATAQRLASKLSFDSIYLGGGTPSLLSAADIDGLLESLHHYYSIDEDCETTIEVNPGTIDSVKLTAFRKSGINRISIGVQSFIDRELQRLERIHTAAEARRAISESRQCGFDNLSIDLIFAIPGQKISDWQFSLETAVDCQPQHLSVYNLTYEPGTSFSERRRQGTLRALSDSAESRQFKHARSFLEKTGYQAYEISNYARSEALVSRHNYKYWRHVPYLGFGPAAHSFWENKRWANVRTVSGYIGRLQKGNLPHTALENLNVDTLKFEHILLSLRTSRGLHLETYEKKFDVRFINEYSSLTENMIKQKFALISDGFFRLTEKGLLFYNEIIPDFAKI